ncbi:unnamed protein product, partial [Ectocarpus sp. 12 AP-2014]
NLNSKTAGGSSVLEPTNKVVFFFHGKLRVTVKERRKGRGYKIVKS